MTQTEWSGLLAAVASAAQHPWVHQHVTGTDLLTDGHRLRFTRPEWTAFVQAARAGECTRQALAV